LRISASTEPLSSRRKLRPSRWPVSRHALIACAGLCGVALAPHVAFGAGVAGPSTTRVVQAIDPDSELLVALNIGQFRIADDVTAAPLNGQMCVDIQQVFNSLDFPIVVDRSRQLASGWFVREDQTVSVNLATQTAQVSGRDVALPPSSFGEVSTGPCMTSGALATLLSLKFDYDPRSTVLAISSQTPLPLMERLARQGRTKLRGLSSSQSFLGPRPQSLPYRAFVPPNTDITISFGAQQDKLTKRETTAAWGLLSIGELAFMTAEAQLAGNQAGFNGAVSRVKLYRAEREGGVFGISALTEVSLGDISAYGSALGSIGGTGLGFSASSFPLNRPTSFDRTNFEGALPLGWDVELYRNGQLLEFANDGANGGYSFKDVPVLFGDNNFEIVQYGPQGQRRVINRRINASNFLAPKGAAYYRAAVYRPELTFGRVNAGSGIRLDLRAAFGVGKNLNLGGGLDSYVVGGRRISIASLSAQTSLSGFALNSELALNLAGTLAGQIEFQGSGRASGVRGRLVLAQEGFRSERIFNNQLARFEISADRGVVFGPQTNGTLSGRFQFDRYHTGESAFTARQRFTLSHGNSWLSQSLAWSHTSSGERRDQIDGEVAYSMRRGRQGMRAAVEFGLYPNPQINRVSAVVERSFSVNPNSWRWRAETSWNRNENEFGYLLALSRNFKATTFDLVAETNGQDRHRIGINLSFALGRRADGWGITSRPLAQTGTVRARLFEDMDDNGRFSEGDVPVVGAGVRAQSSLVASMTNANGYAVVDSVTPNERAQIAVDTDDLADSSLFARSTYTLPREGTVSEIAIPLTQMGAIEGTVEMVAGFEGSQSPIGGVNLVLLDSQNKEISRAVSAYDGFYSFEHVPVGAYRVALAPDSALAQRLRPVEALEVRTTRAEPGAQGLAMTLIETNPTSVKMALRGLL
jgi:hypothetical protein